jgi:peroxiredoxin
VPECAMFIENECRCGPPPPSLQTVGYLTQHKLHRSKICVSKIKNLSKNLNCFRGQKTEIFGFSEKSNTSHQKCPKKHFLCVS